MKYPCTKCGACCKRINLILESWGPAIKDSNNLLYFPYKWDENGVCEMLDENNQCKVYEKRPLVCSIDGVRLLLKLDKDEFYKANAEVCNKMMDEDNLDESLRVKFE